MLKKIDDFIVMIEIKILQILLLFIVTFVFIAAIFRSKLIGYPIVWSVDLASLLFVWICFIGADIALQNNKHIGVDFIANKIPEKIYKIIKVIIYLMIIIFLVIVTVYGINLAIINYKRQYSSLEISYSWATSAGPVGCILMIRTLIKKLYRLITKKPDEVNTGSEEEFDN